MHRTTHHPRPAARRGVTALALAAGALLATGAMAPAHAVPPSSQPFELDCDNGVTYLARAGGNGDWTPAHVVGSTTRLLPVAFDGLTATGLAADGSVVFTEPVPDMTRGGRHVADTRCAFAITGALPDGLSFRYAGFVSVRVVPGT